MERPVPHSNAAIPWTSQYISGNLRPFALVLNGDGPGCIRGISVCPLLPETLCVVPCDCLPADEGFFLNLMRRFQAPLALVCTSLMMVVPAAAQNAIHVDRPTCGLGRPTRRH